MDNTLLSLLSSGKYKTSKDLPEAKEAMLPYLEFITGATPQTDDYQPGLIDMALAVPIVGGIGKKVSKAGAKKVLKDSLPKINFDSLIKDIATEQMSNIAQESIGMQDGGIVGYENGGGVDIDPYADTSQEETLKNLGILVHEGSDMLPTYDTTGANLARRLYEVRQDQGREQAVGSLMDLNRQITEKSATGGFAGQGALPQAMTDVRDDIVSGYGLSAQEDYLNLQKTMHGFHKDFERDILAGLEDMPEGSWDFVGEDWLANQEEREAEGRGEGTIDIGAVDPTTGESIQFQPPTGYGYEGEQRIGQDGVMYTWHPQTNSWIPNQAGSGGLYSGGDLASMGAHSTYG